MVKWSGLQPFLLRWTVELHPFPNPLFPDRIKGAVSTPMKVILAPVLISEIPKISVQPTNMSSRFCCYSSVSASEVFVFMIPLVCRTVSQPR
jgi:hypothetical protein